MFYFITPLSTIKRFFFLFSFYIVPYFCVCVFCVCVFLPQPPSFTPFHEAERDNFPGPWKGVTHDVDYCSREVSKQEDRQTDRRTCRQTDEQTARDWAVATQKPQHKDLSIIP